MRKIAIILYIFSFFVASSLTVQLWAHGNDHLLEEIIAQEQAAQAESNSEPSMTAASKEALAKLNSQAYSAKINSALLKSWTFDPSLIVIALLVMLYCNYFRKLQPALRKKKLWRLVVFFIGIFALTFSLVSPLDAFADFSFLAHMIQHLLITIGGAFLIALGQPYPAIIKGFPDRFKKVAVIPVAKNAIFRRCLAVLINPYFAIIAYVANMWFWHYPPAYDLALANEMFHYLEHFLFFITALLLWINVFPSTDNIGIQGLFRFVYMFLFMISDNALGAAIFFYDTALYEFKEVYLWGFSVLEHQKMGGLLMWVGGNILFFLIMQVILWDVYFKYKQRELLAEA